MFQSEYEQLNYAQQLKEKLEDFTQDFLPHMKEEEEVRLVSSSSGLSVIYTTQNTADVTPIAQDHFKVYHIIHIYKLDPCVRF